MELKMLVLSPEGRLAALRARACTPAGRDSLAGWCAVGRPSLCRQELSPAAPPRTLGEASAVHGGPGTPGCWEGAGSTEVAGAAAGAEGASGSSAR